MTAHRKRRIAADEAHSWARNLRLRNPYAKLVLGMLTLYVTGDGSCFVGIEQLADDTELSADTVRKRLAWLEQIGAIARFPQWIDGSGRRNGEGKGKRTSDEIRLLIDADPDLIEARASGEDVVEDATETAEVSPRCQQGLNHPEDSVSPRPALGQPSDSGKGHNEPEPEPEDSPQPPSGGSEPAPDGWKEFEEAYPGPILRQSLARNAFTALNAIERDMATKAARGYGLWLKAQRKPPNVLGAHLFLKERDAWAQYVERSETVAQRRIVPADSDEARAYVALRVLAGASPPYTASDGTITLPRPLTDAELAFAHLPQKTDWVFIAERQQQGSWIGFLNDAVPNIARRPLITEHRFNGETHSGFYAPWPWPPRKDGSLCVGPPAAA